MVAQGELWWLETPNDKRRPVLVVSRDAAIAVLRNLVVAPVTSSLRRIPTCLRLGPEEGLDHESEASFDNMATVPKALLTTRIGELGAAGRAELCGAMRAVADC